MFRFAGHLAATAFIKVVTLFGASLYLVLALVTWAYERFDGGFSDLAAESRRRRAARNAWPPPPSDRLIRSICTVFSAPSSHGSRPVDRLGHVPARIR